MAALQKKAYVKATKEPDGKGFGPDHPKVATVLQNMAGYCQKKRKREEAESWET
jgi:hypothetical protein